MGSRTQQPATFKPLGILLYAAHELYVHHTSKGIFVASYTTAVGSNKKFSIPLQ